MKLLEKIKQISINAQMKTKEEDENFINKIIKLITEQIEINAEEGKQYYFTNLVSVDNKLISLDAWEKVKKYFENEGFYVKLNTAYHYMRLKIEW